MEYQLLNYYLNEIIMRYMDKNRRECKLINIYIYI